MKVMVAGRDVVCPYSAAMGSGEVARGSHPFRPQPVKTWRAPSHMRKPAAEIVANNLGLVGRRVSQGQRTIDKPAAVRIPSHSARHARPRSRAVARRTVAHIDHNRRRHLPPQRRKRGDQLAVMRKMRGSTVRFSAARVGFSVGGISRQRG